MSNEILDNDVIDDIIDINLQECYICYDYCDTLSPCDCKTLYIHKECQKMLVNKTKVTKCKICNKEYNNIKVDIKYKFHITKFGKYFLCKNFILIIIFGCFIVETSIAIGHNYYFLIISGLILIPILLLIYFIIKDIRNMYINNIYIIKNKEVKQIYILND